MCEARHFYLHILAERVRKGHDLTTVISYELQFWCNSALFEVADLGFGFRVECSRVFASWILSDESTSRNDTQHIQNIYKTYTKVTKDIKRMKTRKIWPSAKCCDLLRSWLRSLRRNCRSKTAPPSLHDLANRPLPEHVFFISKYDLQFRDLTIYLESSVRQCNYFKYL